MPSTRHAGARRTPDACASKMSSRITSRCPRSCRRPRPPRRVSPLFFEHEQRCSFSQCLLHASELALELANPLDRRRRGSSALVKGDPPLLVVGELHPFAFEVGGQRLAIKMGRLGENTSFLLNRPLAHDGLRFIGHDRQATRLLQPARQVLLPDPGLPSQLQCTHCVVAGEPLDHLLFKRQGEQLAHVVVEFSPLRGSTSNDATTILTQGAGMDLLNLVAKGGIEPPTHGFSVRCSTN